MSESSSEKMSGNEAASKEKPPSIIECSSPPCMLHELDLVFVEHSERLPSVNSADGGPRAKGPTTVAQPEAVGRVSREQETTPAMISDGSFGPAPSMSAPLPTARRPL